MNPASAVVQKYSIDIAKEAAAAGVDDITFDYLRRADGRASDMVFVGTTSPIEDSMVSFLRDAGRALRGTKTRVGVSVSGFAANYPERVSQPLVRFAAVVDYISPVLYPSQWEDGDYGVPDPMSEPDIVVW